MIQEPNLVGDSFAGSVAGDAGRSLWQRIRKHQPIIVDLIGVAVLWQISTYFFSPAIVPPIGDIGAAIWKIFSQWSNLVNLLVTSIRVLVALLLAFALGTTLGVVMDSSREYEPTSVLCLT